MNRSSSLKETIGTSHSFRYNSPKLLKKRSYNLRSNKDRQKRRNAKRLGLLLDGYESDTTAVISDVIFAAGKAALPLNSNIVSDGTFI